MQFEKFELQYEAEKLLDAKFGVQKLITNFEKVL